MRILSKSYLMVMALLAGAFAVASCDDDDSSEAKAVLSSKNKLEFASKDAPAQTVTIYSDAEWSVDAPDWISVSPTSGSGTSDVEITVTDNYSGGVEDSPRSDTVAFHGHLLRSYCYVVVSQDGDEFKTAPEVEVSGIASVEKGSNLKVKNAKVAALTKGAALLTDGKSYAILEDNSGVSVGKALSFRGTRSTYMGIPSVKNVENLTATAAEFTAPTAKDITDGFASYAPAGVEYVTVTGVFDGSLLKQRGVDSNSASFVDAPDSYGLADLAGHEVKATGYAFATESGSFDIILTGIEDKGLSILIYFQDDFGWVKPWADATDAGDAVGESNASAKAPNVYSVEGTEGFLDEFAKRGYEDVNAEAINSSADDKNDYRVIYLQKYYLKFSKTKYAGGIRLPKMEFGEKPVDAVLTFDWCSQLTGAGKVDPTVLVVTVENAGVCGDSGKAKSNEIASVQEKDQFFWQTITIPLKGVTSDTRITITPNKYGNVGNKVQYRWYLDNIKVTEPTK